MPHGVSQADKQQHHAPRHLASRLPAPTPIPPLLRSLLKTVMLIKVNPATRVAAVGDCVPQTASSLAWEARSHRFADFLNLMSAFHPVARTSEKSGYKRSLAGTSPLAS